MNCSRDTVRNVAASLSRFEFPSRSALWSSHRGRRENATASAWARRYDHFGFELDHPSLHPRSTQTLRGQHARRGRANVSSNVRYSCGAIAGVGRSAMHQRFCRQRARSRCAGASPSGAYTAAPSDTPRASRPCRARTPMRRGRSRPCSRVSARHGAPAPATMLRAPTRFVALLLLVVTGSTRNGQ